MPHRRFSGGLQKSLQLYGNCRVLTGETLMFRCDSQRRDWYLSSGLAEVVSQDPDVIRLTFQPKGPGHAGDPYFLQEFKNRCVVCGLKEDLTHHHVVPYCYRRYYPRESYENGRWFYDVLLLCIPCHDRYEDLAHQLKLDISAEHGVNIAGECNLTRDEIRIMKAGSALHRHGEKMPLDRRLEFEAVLKTYLGKETLDPEDPLLAWQAVRRGIKSTPAAEIVVRQLLDLDDFAIRWRRHFIKYMKPRFLPELWNPERRLYSEPK